MANQRDQWGSSLGFILAAVGSAVGLGNLWKFPYITWSNDGGAFVLIYLVCILGIGMPVMMAEILIGKRAQNSPVPAFETLSKNIPGGPKVWGLVGWLGVLAGVVILSFYAVIAGWSISSFINCLKWSFTGYEAPTPDAFNEFVGNGPLQLLLSFIFSGVTCLIVMRGISGGIEKATRVLMPVLLLIMCLLVLNSFFLDGIGQTFSFLFNPDFSKVGDHAVLEALGHAFFTLSLGMGAMITYGSYMPRKESILRAGIAILILDTLIALMACIVMYSIIFSFPEIQEKIGKSTAGMLFITLPQMFYSKMPGGSIVGPVFFVLVGFAALSSTISLLEVVVSLVVDKMGINRKKATIMSSCTVFVLTIFCALSMGSSNFLTNFKFFGKSETGFLAGLNHLFFADKEGFLNLFDHLSANWLLPVGGFFITIFVGWFLDKRVIVEELELARPNGSYKPFYYVYQVMIKVLAPAAIGYIIYKVFTGTDFT